MTSITYYVKSWSEFYKLREREALISKEFRGRVVYQGKKWIKKIGRPKNVDSRSPLMVIVKI